MEPGTLPSSKHIHFQWRWQQKEGGGGEGQQGEGDKEGGSEEQWAVGNFFDPSDKVLNTSVMASEELSAVKAKSVVSSDDPIADSKEEGWYWAVTGLRNGTIGPLVLFASLAVKYVMSCHAICYCACLVSPMTL